MDVVREIDYYSRQSEKVRAPLYVVGFAIGAIMAVGLLGGLFPALRAARMPVAAALKAE